MPQKRRDTMNKHEDKYVIAVYGKKGCDKCVSLLNRLKKIVAQAKYEDLEIQYYDLSTIEGLVAMAKGETINGQRLPSLQVLKQTDKGLVKLRDPRKEEFRDNRMMVPVYLQLETDYSDRKRAVIKSEEIEEILNLAVYGERV